MCASKTPAARTGGKYAPDVTPINLRARRPGRGDP